MEDRTVDLVIIVGGSEWAMTSQHFAYNNTQGPPVDCFRYGDMGFMRFDEPMGLGTWLPVLRWILEQIVSA